VEWDSQGGYRADPSLQSFLFTLKNPHNLPARKFALKAEKKNKAIDCDSSMGPRFGDDIWVLDNCNENASSWNYLGHSYANDTGLDGRTLLSFLHWFTVKEDEVFKITD
jgi:hypothetical protein